MFNFFMCHPVHQHLYALLTCPYLTESGNPTKNVTEDGFSTNDVVQTLGPQIQCISSNYWPKAWQKKTTNFGL